MADTKISTLSSATTPLAGTPDGAVSAPVGSLYTRTNGGAGTPEVLDALATVAGGVALIGWYEVAA
jgi:hypothetical protein